MAKSSPASRLPSGLEVAGILRRIEAASDFATVLRKGDKDRGALLLLSPPDAGAEHLKALAAISRVTRHGATLEKMRGARTRDALAAVLMGADERDAA